MGIRYRLVFGEVACPTLSGGTFDQAVPKAAQVPLGCNYCVIWWDIWSFLGQYLTFSPVAYGTSHERYHALSAGKDNGLD